MPLKSRWIDLDDISFGNGSMEMARPMLSSSLLLLVCQIAFSAPTEAATPLGVETRDARRGAQRVLHQFVGGGAGMAQPSTVPKAIPLDDPVAIKAARQVALVNAAHRAGG